MATVQGSLANIYNWPASLGVTLGTGQYPNGTITFSHKDGVIENAVWKDNTGTRHTYTICLCDSAGNNRVALTPTLDIGPSSLTYTASFSASNGTALAGKALYIVPLRDGTVCSNGFAFKTNSWVTITIADQTWTLTTAVSPSGYGTVTAGGAMTYNSTKSLTATPAAGRNFSSWSKTAGTLSSTTTNPTTFTMGTSAATVTANFGTNNYTLTVSKGTGGASVTGGGTVAYGSSNNISATASTGYTFKNWTSNNGGTFGNANSASTTFTMPAGNTTVTANFTINSHTLTTAVSPSGYGTVTAGATLNYGATKSLTATASTGRYFSSWSKTSGTLSSTTTNPTTFTMGDANATVTANFGTSSYTLTTAASPAAGGSVTAGGSIAYGGTKSLTATASTGYTFSSWSKTAGTLSSTTTNPTTFTMGASNATVTASFTHNQYTLTVSKGTGGASVTGGGTKYYNDSCSISATASTGYTFKNWTTSSGGSFANANAASTTYTMPNGNATVTANFTHNQYTLTVSKGTGGASVTGGGTKYYNDSCSISATASTGYTFKNWTTSSGGSFANANAASTTYTMPNGNATVTANFTHNTYTLSSAVSPSGGGTVTLGASSGYYNDSINISATPATGYAFSKWTTTGGTLGNADAASTTITLPAANTTVTATFTAIDYSVTTAVDPAGAGTVTANPTTAHYGDTITLSQTPATAYAFDGYTSSPSVTITNSQFSMPASNITVTGNYHITKSTASLDKASYTGGDTAELTINVSSSSFTHRYKLSYGTGMETEWVSLAAGVDSDDIYIPVAWCLNASGATTVTGGTLVLETYDGDTLLGTDTISNLTYVALDETIPTIDVWRCDENENADITGQYVGYEITIPESIVTYDVAYDTEPLSVSSNHDVTLSMTYGSETFTVVRDLPKVVTVQKLIAAN